MRTLAWSMLGAAILASCFGCSIAASVPSNRDKISGIGTNSMTDDTGGTSVPEAGGTTTDPTAPSGAAPPAN
jgi:hypothetical protein